MKSSSGFKGKGFKFDETEAQLCDERRKLQKAALGLQDSDEEDAGVDVSTSATQGQGLSQDLDTGCLKLAIVRFLGIQIFRGYHNILRFKP